MLVFMEEGRFKIFSTLTHVLQEYRQYHRKEGKIVAIRDDCMSAMRYCFMSRRFGVAGSDTTWAFNMDKPIEYQNMGIV
jgi:hypothetical protein